MPFVTPDPTQPADSTPISQGASWIRALTSWLTSFLAVSFNMTDGTIKASAVPNGLPTPYGSAGKILQSTGASTAPIWATVSTTVPIGGVIDYAGAAAPTGFLECDGSILNIADYPALAAICGTTFGGDGITTFGIPDCRGRATVGLGTGSASGATDWTLGRQDGEEVHTLVTSETPSHVHQISNLAAYSGQHQNGTQPAGVYPYVTGVGNKNTDSVGGDGSHNNLQPSLGLRKIIKT